MAYMVARVRLNTFVAANSLTKIMVRVWSEVLWSNQAWAWLACSLIYVYSINYKNTRIQNRKEFKFHAILDLRSSWLLVFRKPVVRVCEIECGMWLTCGRFTIEIIRFFGYPKSAVYDIAQKNANAKSVTVSANPQGKIIRVKRLQGSQVS